MRRTLTLGLFALLLSACGSGNGEADPPADLQADPHTSADLPPSEIAFQLEERDLFPEGMTRDPISGDFFLGSLRKSKILRISGEGEVDTLSDMEELGQGGILGMKVDADRGILWANFHQSAEQLGADPSTPYRTGIYKIDLDSGRLLERYSVEKEDENHLFNDIALASDGTVYITSFSKGTLYRIPGGTGELEEWLPMPGGVFTNGIDIGPQERFLFVVGDNAIYRVGIDSEEVTVLEIPDGEAVHYGDGLYFHQGSLVIIASWRAEELLHYRVASMRLSSDMSAIDEIVVLDQDHPLYAFPTTGAISNGWFYYIATAQFDKVDGEGGVALWDDLSDIYILRVRLPEG